MIDICMYGCRSCNFACAYCMGPEKTKSEKFILDEKNLYNSIVEYKKVRKSEGFAIWGGEPLLHFSELQETVRFLRSNFCNEKIMISTNGFLLQKSEIRDYICKQQLKLQLSVDGIAQDIRSDFNPMKNEKVSEFLALLAKRNLLTINCVMHNKNCSIMQNINYFTNWMKKYKCLDSSLNVRFTPFNESALTPDFNFSGESLKCFLHEFELLYIRSLLGNKNDIISKHFSKYPLKVVKKSNFERIDWVDLNQCSRFFSGKTKISKHIDTKGNFISCNLIDSSISPRGKTNIIIPEYCNNCEFKSMRGCMPCPNSDFAEKCEWKKAWMMFQERMLLLQKYIKRIEK